MTHEYVYETERVGNLIVQVVADMNGEASNPRDNDNVTEIFGDSRRYTIGDGKPPSEHQYILDRGGIRLLARYMRLFGDPRDGSKVLALTMLGMLDHSGISFYTVPLGGKGDHWTDPGGWDSGNVGYVLVTQTSWTKMMGDSDPFAPVPSEIDLPLGSVPVEAQHVWHIVRSEVHEYDDWARGNVWGYVITKPCPNDHGDHDQVDDEEVANCPHSEVIDSCWGYIGEPDEVMKEAVAIAKSYEEVPA